MKKSHNSRIPSTVILSIISDCNLCCTYCQTGPYLRGKTEYVKMPLEIVEKIVKDIFQYAQKHSLSSVEFHFSGGEPLLAGINFFDSMLRLQKKHNKNLIKVINSVQTNGTLINEDWAHFFKLNEFGLSISCDGPQDVQDKNRPNINGSGSFLDLLNSIEILRLYELPFGLISVVTKNSVPQVESIIKFLFSCEPVNIAFLPCADRPAIESNDWTEFMIKAFDIWTNPNINTNAIPVRSFRTILLYLCGMPPFGRSCDYTPDCLYPNISPDGIVSVCDQFVGKPDGYLGDIKLNSLSDILVQDRAVLFSNKYSELPSLCEGCNYKKLCFGGCAYRRYINHGFDYLCDSRKKIFSYIDSKVDNILEALRCELMEKD